MLECLRLSSQKWRIPFASCCQIAQVIWPKGFLAMNTKSNPWQPLNLKISRRRLLKRLRWTAFPLERENAKAVRIKAKPVTLQWIRKCGVEWIFFCLKTSATSLLVIEFFMAHHFLYLAPANLLRPLLRLLAITSRPPAVSIRLRNPVARTRLILLGWYVLFIFDSKKLMVFRWHRSGQLNSLKIKNVNAPRGQKRF